MLPQATVAENEEQFPKVVAALVSLFRPPQGTRLLAHRGAAVIRVRPSWPAATTTVRDPAANGLRLWFVVFEGDPPVYVVAEIVSAVRRCGKQNSLCFQNSSSGGNSEHQHHHQNTDSVQVTGDTVSITPGRFILCMLRTYRGSW